MYSICSPAYSFVLIQDDTEYNTQYLLQHRACPEPTVVSAGCIDRGIPEQVLSQPSKCEPLGGRTSSRVSRLPAPPLHSMRAGSDET